jgi:predicted enzyme related to lactoylglutathione lyase
LRNGAQQARIRRNATATGTFPMTRLGQLALALWLASGVAAAVQADGPQLTGKFVWADLVTDDVTAARKFYGELFGWTFEDTGDYAIALNDGRPVGGLFARPRPKDEPGQPRWIGYVSVADVQRVRDAVTRAGGRVLLRPQKFPGRGDQAVFADDGGALFGVVHSSSGDPEDFLPEPGDWIWMQLLTHDARQAGRFYQSVGGYEVIVNTASSLPDSFLLARDGYARAAITALPPEYGQVKPAWLPFVRVLSVTTSVEQARQLGGNVLLEPAPALLDGRVAVIADPTGAAVGILEWSPDSAGQDSKP